MKFNIVTIFPEIFHAYLNEGIVKRAVNRQLIEITVHNLRDYTKDKHRSVDDYPYGGGGGMVMKPEPFFDVIEAVSPLKSERRVIMLGPAGETFNQEMAMQLSYEQKNMILLCGRYEEMDERIRTALVDDEVSIGDYVLTGGELPALVIIDAVTRLIPGVLGDERSAGEDSFSRGILDFPHYTRPPVFRDMPVPGVLLSGNHREITRWRKKEALRRTFLRRPDLLETGEFSDEDLKLINEIKGETS
jgi:tRNA (guanine37-N1)-methyltransferase